MTRKKVVLGLDPASLATAMTVFANEKKFLQIIAGDCDEAVRAILEETPDMAVLDMSMGGDACCKRVKSASATTLIVLLVSPDDHDDIGRCLNACCDAIIMKPLVYQYLSDMVTRLLFPETNSTFRFPVRIPVRYGTTPDALAENHSFDLTSHGTFIETEQPMAVGTTLHLVLDLTTSSNKTVQCTARVAWVNDPVSMRASLLPPGMGLEFMHLAPLQMNAIRDFIFFQKWGGQSVS